MRARVGVIAAGVLAALLVPFVFSPPTQGVDCFEGEHSTVETGIVRATACWTKSTNDNGDEIYTAKFENQTGIDLNGFIVDGERGRGLQVNATTREVRGVSLDSGETDFVQLSSLNWPSAGQISPLGAPIKLDFIAPENSGLLLEDLHFGDNSFINSMAGLSPVGTIEAPIRLLPEGTGSMDLTVALAGIFTLRGMPQSVTISLPTASGQGTRFDGFEFHLQEIGAINGFTINDLEGKYSRSENLIAGSATASFPFFSGGRGFKVGFNLQNGTITGMQAGVHGVKIPIGAPPGGVITDVDGGFHFIGVKPADFDGYCKSQGYEGARLIGPDHGTWAITHWRCHKGSQDDSIDVDKACRWQSKNESAYARYSDGSDAYSWKCVGFGISGDFDLIVNVDLGADFGPEIPTPFGETAPIRVDAGAQVGYSDGGVLIKITGGVQIFRLPAGDVYLAIHSNSGVEFGVGLGIGFPSYTNNENDPFYIGARVDGWVGKGKFQFEGKGRVALFGIKAFDGRVLVNDTVAGACWVLLGFPGGSYYRYGESKVHDFGVGCGLDDFKEQFPGGQQLSPKRSGTFDLSAEEGVLEVEGDGAAPRFTLRSDDGRVFRTPEHGPSVLTRDHAVFVNQGTNMTHVVLRDPRGDWTVTPEAGSAPITGVRAARKAPRERVTAEVSGRGSAHTLTWDSQNRPHTRLVFTEVAPGGVETPILETGKASGRHRFRTPPHGGYGHRRLRVVVVHGYASRQSAVLDRYRVRPPRPLPAPRRVSALRDGHDVRVRWSRVAGARGYFVHVSMRRRGRLVSNYVREVGARRRSVIVRHHPGGGRAVATVRALNGRGGQGKKRSAVFATNPQTTTIGQAAKQSARSASLRDGGVSILGRCPSGGHCRTTADLLLGNRRLARAHFQQTPDTFHRLRLVPSGPSARRALRRNADALRVAIEIHRSGRHARAEADVRP